MRLISTRGGGGVTHPAGGSPPTWSFTEALFLGPAPDGGLFVPAAIPPLPEEDRAALAGLDLPRTGLFGGAPLARRRGPGRCPARGGARRAELPRPPSGNRARRAHAGTLPRPHPRLQGRRRPLHGAHDVGGGRAGAAPAPGDAVAAPTDAAPTDNAFPVTILTATSGDTGGAVAHAFHGVSGVRVLVFFPIGKISPRQEAQITTLGGNVTAVAVRGTFDDCQRLVRQAFTDPSLNARMPLTSANSINIGRLLPQTFYYVHAWAELARESQRSARDSGRVACDLGRPVHDSERAVRDSRRAASDSGQKAPGAVRTAPAPAQGTPGPELVIAVPSGNFGNLTAGLIARRALGMSRARLGRRDQCQLGGSGIPRRARLPPPPLGRDHLQRDGRRRPRQLPADPAPVRGSAGRPGSSWRPGSPRRSRGSRPARAPRCPLGLRLVGRRDARVHPRPVAAARHRHRSAHRGGAARLAS